MTPAAPLPEAPGSPDAAPAPPDWTGPARAGEWRRALAAARVSWGPPELVEALEAAYGVQDGVRARRWPAARRAAARLDEALAAARGGGLVGEAALIDALTRPSGLGAGLAELEGLGRGAGGETEPEALRARLAEALGHPLTRAEAQNALGVLHALRDEPGEARARFEEAVAGDPGHYRALTNLGNLDLEAGQAAGAEARYREALRVNPDFDGAHHNLGVALRRQGRLHESVGSIRRAQRLSVRRTQEETREELREQWGSSAAVRNLRLVVLAAVLVAVFLLLRGAVT